MKGENICRRYPPQSHVVTTPVPPKPPAVMPTLQHELRTFFPTMDAKLGWCGCYEREGLVQ